MSTSYPAAPDAAALRDAAIALRVSADEEAADAERASPGRRRAPELGPEVRGTPQLTDGELVHAIRHAAILDEGDAATPGVATSTSRRAEWSTWVESSREISLDAIEESAVSLERLLLLDLTDGSDTAIEVDQPRLLRVQLAAARANAHGGARHDRHPA